MLQGFIDEENRQRQDKERSARIEAIIRQYADMIYRIAYQNTGCQADAEDILQEVSLMLVTKKAPLHDEEHLKHWLIRVTIHRCRDFKRRQKRTRTEPLEDHEDLAAEEPYLFCADGWTSLSVPQPEPTASLIRPGEGFFSVTPTVT